MEQLQSPQGSFDLERVPVKPRQPLRAWDAADEYVLQLLSEEPIDTGSSIVLANDAFGALAVALFDDQPLVINESAAGRQAVVENLGRNGRGSVEVLSMLELAERETPIDTLVIKVPKSNAHLTDLLQRVRPHLHAGSRVIGAAMARHVKTSTIECFESIIGPTTTSLARKKARLLYTTLDPALAPSPNPWPITWKRKNLTLVNHGGGFSPDAVDVGTRFLLENLPPIRDLIPLDRDTVRVVDLGCGNGIIGLHVAAELVAAEIDYRMAFLDDSALAIDAAQRSWEATMGEPQQGEQVVFQHAHRLVGALPKRSVNLVLVNPPFHDDRVVGDDVAWSMFTDAHKVLDPGGQLIVVGNRHLAYHAKLKKIFGQVETVAATSKFVLLRAHR